MSATAVDPGMSRLLLLVLEGAGVSGSNATDDVWRLVAAWCSESRPVVEDRPP
eukprot:CAMPEP_0168499778 /NCGR_PEP_ID=MMETSP0228-20121227/73952_1 /TAXON_ID=133427 /ORGANISM="Protoceratium reticulatum, Strain CCCM 535 (=CCMP 1889)" /LENGTH=52 /DNA_ID=CAMNT_0008516687 /DNA_START=196 /DNA_END=351 /DNA_ORIENTATION=+